VTQGVNAMMIEEEQKRKIEGSLERCRVTLPRKGRLIARIPRDSLSSALLLLKAEGFEHLSMISCVDWIDEGELELVYHLWSYRDKIHAMVKTRLGRDSPRFLSIIPIFRHAQTYERELHEMFGIHFEGNPRLTPFLLDHWREAPPMRRDFDLRGHVKEKFGVEERT
jgi:NADH-quinone oxidoreductase subunit C